MLRDAIRRLIFWSATIATLITVSGTVSAQAPDSAAALPAPVRKAFEQSYPGATISAVSRATDNGQVVFRVDGRDKGRRRVVLYDTTGKVVETAEDVQEKELPKAVADAMHSHPRAIYVSGTKVTRGGNVEYRLTVRGTRKTAMVARPDGSVISFK